MPAPIIKKCHPSGMVVAYRQQSEATKNAIREANKRRWEERRQERDQEQSKAQNACPVLGLSANDNTQKLKTGENLGTNTHLPMGVMAVGVRLEAHLLPGNDLTFAERIGWTEAIEAIQTSNDKINETNESNNKLNEFETFEHQMSKVHISASNAKTYLDNQQTILDLLVESAMKSEEEKAETQLINHINSQRRPVNFSSKNALHVKDCAAVLQRMFGKKRLAFVTNTMPDMDRIDELLVIENWGKILKDFFDSIRHHLRKFDTELWLVNVTEIHKKALKRGRCKYHIHFIFMNKLNGFTRWLITTKLNDRLWQAQIDKYTTKKYKCKANKMETVKKNAGAYISKYMTKGMNDVNKTIQKEKEKNPNFNVQVFAPQQWYYSTQNLKQEVKQFIEERTIEFHDYKGGLEQFYKDMVDGKYKHQIRGLSKYPPHKATYINKKGEEVLSAVIYWVGFEWVDYLINDLPEAMHYVSMHNKYGDELPGLAA